MHPRKQSSKNDLYVAIRSALRDPDNMPEIFSLAKNVRIYNGEVILPSGEFWSFVDGKKEPHDPIFVFTSGPLPDGEV
jgi:hypothetical protein